jgi:class 3 adenylate cyclase
VLVRKTVTVLFSDLVMSTESFERLDPESWRQVMSRYFAEMQAVIERHGGTTEKFIGDAVMAVFGVPVVHEDDALRAVRAAGEMRDRLGSLNDELEATWGVRLQMRIGVNTGEVVAGDPNTGSTFVTGEAVVVAKRLEQAAEAGEILIGKSTYPLVKDAVKAGPLESFQIKGKSQPVAPFRLEHVEAGRSDSRGAWTRLSSVGVRSWTSCKWRSRRRFATARAGSSPFSARPGSASPGSPASSSPGSATAQPRCEAAACRTGRASPSGR